jgi:hypothetical protein
MSIPMINQVLLKRPSSWTSIPMINQVLLQQPFSWCILSFDSHFES